MISVKLLPDAPDVLTGNSMWQPTMILSGKITAHAEPLICQASGTNDVLTIIIPMTRVKQTVHENQNLKTRQPSVNR